MADRGTTYSLMGVGGGAAMVAGSFLPWLSNSFQRFSGWDLYDLRNDAGENPFMIDEMFDDTFDPFFTGATTLVIGLVLAATAVGALWLPTRPPPSRLRVPTGLYAVAVIAMVAGMLVLALNVMAYVTRPDGLDVDLLYGFHVTVAGFALAAVGLQGAMNPGRRASTGAPVADPSTAPPTAGWYPDPNRRHEVRYWDGAAWTTHVADAGAPGEDPVRVS